MIGLLTAPLFKWGAILLFIGALFGGTWYMGDQHGTAKLAAYQAQQAKVVAATESKEAAVTTQVVVKYVHDQVVIHDKAQIITKEVPQYVTVKDDSACTINNGFVGLWNDANANAVPPTPSGADEAPSSVKLSDVAAEHGREAELYNQTANQLIELQNWVKAQVAVR
jgi:hypothetical protein